MKNLMKKQSMRVFIAALVCIFTLSTVAPVHAKKTRLKKWMQEHTITTKLVRLDRVDGFAFGLSFKGHKIPDILIAPGPDLMLLVQVDENEMIMQADQETGQWQVISATGDFMTLLCYVQQVLSMLSSVQTCSTGLCYASAIISFLMNLQTCAVPTTT